MYPERPPSFLHGEALSHLAHELGERVKELNCLFGLSDIVERGGRSLDQILRETVELLTESWDHSDVACARIILGEDEIRSRSWREPQETQRAEIRIRGENAGAVEVSYFEIRPPKDEGPFTEEERRLLDAVAERVGHIIERLTTEEYLREKEEEFRKKMTHLSRVNTVGELATNIAHEVNQPLTAIANYAQACELMVERGRMEGAEVLEILKRIGDEAIRAGDIIRRLRNLVRQRDTKRVECDIVGLIQEVDPLASVDARLNDVRLRVVTPSDVPPILADGVQIQQVLLNLMRNGIDAMEATPRESSILEVSVEPLDGQVQVSVSDRGCGLPEVSEDALFEPFFTTKATGMGLGLSISRSIVASHGGRLWFLRNPKGGTTFFFTLPVVAEATNG